MPPPIEILLIVKAAVPVLVSVTGMGALVVPACWFKKFNDAGETLATGAMPVPLRDTFCDATGDAKATVRFELNVPAAVGPNVTLNVQVALAASVLLLQFVAAENCAGAVTLVIMIEVAPVFFTVTGVAALVVPTNWLPKGMLNGETDVPAWSCGANPANNAQKVIGANRRIRLLIGDLRELSRTKRKRTQFGFGAAFPLFNPSGPRKPHLNGGFSISCAPAGEETSAQAHVCLSGCTNAIPHPYSSLAIKGLLHKMEPAREPARAFPQATVCE